jgi:hypothetical protein
MCGDGRFRCVARRASSESGDLGHRLTERAAVGGPGRGHRLVVHVAHGASVLGGDRSIDAGDQGAPLGSFRVSAAVPGQGLDRRRALVRCGALSLEPRQPPDSTVRGVPSGLVMPCSVTTRSRSAFSASRTSRASLRSGASSTDGRRKMSTGADGKHAVHADSPASATDSSPLRPDCSVSHANSMVGNYVAHPMDEWT